MKSIKPYLLHILAECEFLIDNLKQTNYEDFLKNDVLQRAFVRSLEIIGEAAKKIQSDFRKKHLDIPWKEISGMRDKLIHDYFGVNYKIVWKTVVEDIPVLRDKISEILKNLRD